MDQLGELICRVKNGDGESFEKNRRENEVYYRKVCPQ